MASVETEVLAAIYAILSGSTALTANSGLDPATGSARAVSVYNQVRQDAPLPYVRIYVTDTTVMDGEPFEYNYTPTTKKVHFMVDVFSDYHPEMLNISSVVQNLLQHVELSTLHFHGSTWMKSADNFQDDTSTPDRVYQRASIRFDARMTAIS